MSFAKGKIGNKGADAWVFCLYLALVSLGVNTLYHVGLPMEGYPADWASFIFATLVGKQIIWFLISMAVFVAVFFVLDAELWRTYAYPIYGITLAGLVLVLLFGTEIKGAQSWFRFGGFTIQPSELAKFGTSLAMATYLSSWSNKLHDLQNLSVGIGIWLFPSLLILLQPDAGSALVFFSFLIAMYREGMSPVYFWLAACAIGGFILGILFSPLVIAWFLALAFMMYLLARVPQRRWVLVALIVIAGSGLLFAFFQGWLWPSILVMLAIMAAASLYHLLGPDGHWVRVGWGSFALAVAFLFGANFFFNEVLQPHQQARINVWLQPTETDARGAGYNVAQSKLAMASGGVLGQGEGVLTRFGHVPEKETDFIFSAMAEQAGLIGVLLTLGLYAALLFRITILAERQRMAFSRVYAYGVAGILFVHLLINVGMVVGLMPVIGIPLPFISKGGSSLVGFTLMLAVLLKLDKFREQV